MLVVISPAKRLDWSDSPGLFCSEPVFSKEAIELVAVMRSQSQSALQKLMGISADLARLNADRFASFSTTPAPETLRPAVRAFAGDTYAGLEAKSLESDALIWAQDHLRILSGLYGVLRPLDGIQPYRLEMGSRLATARGTSLYAFWADRLALSLRRDADAAGTDLLVNCASREYFGAVPEAPLGLRVVTPVFLEDRTGGPKIVSVFAKKARGAMARFIVERRLTDPAGLTDFDTGGYRHRPDLSTPDRPVFLRGGELSNAA